MPAPYEDSVCKNPDDLTPTRQLFAPDYVATIERHTGDPSEEESKAAAILQWLSKVKNKQMLAMSNFIYTLWVEQPNASSSPSILHHRKGELKMKS